MTLSRLKWRDEQNFGGESKEYIVYKLTNNKTGESYIGKTSKDIEGRWREHICAFKGNYFKGKVCRKLYEAFKKYGIRCWSKEIIFRTDDECEAYKKEEELINVLNTANKGYNNLDYKSKREKFLTSSHEWKIAFPNGKIKIIRSLRKFCRELGISNNLIRTLETGEPDNSGFQVLERIKAVN